MLLGCIADDFTGASDLANTLAKGGMATTQFMGVPTRAAPPSCDAGVVALKSRSIAVEQAVRQSLEALDWLRSQGCRQFLFKYCSTFDSTPAGNIGPVAEALANALGAKGVIVCPAFPTAGRTVYQGHLFVDDRLLSESGMQHHPLNPMTDPDLRRWLALQCTSPVGHLPLPIIRKGPDAIRAALAATNDICVVADAVTDEDLTTLGIAAADSTLISGGSGIALGLPGNFRRAGLLAGGRNGFTAVKGPGAILAGSCSSATLRQIDEHRKHHPSRAIDSDAVMAGDLDAEALARFVLDRLGDDPLLYSSADPSTVAAMQTRYGAEAVAHKLETLFGAVAATLVANGVKRLTVAGGETSGAVIAALGIESVEIGPEIDPGVPALSTAALAGECSALALALKSGNFGRPDFFARALHILEGGA